MTTVVPVVAFDVSGLVGVFVVIGAVVVVTVGVDAVVVVAAVVTVIVVVVSAVVVVVGVTLPAVSDPLDDPGGAGCKGSAAFNETELL